MKFVTLPSTSFASTPKTRVTISPNCSSSLFSLSAETSLAAQRHFTSKLPIQVDESESDF